MALMQREIIILPYRCEHKNGYCLIGSNFLRSFNLQSGILVNVSVSHSKGLISFILHVPKKEYIMAAYLADS